MDDGILSKSKNVLIFSIISKVSYLITSSLKNKNKL